jgi:hypothetical protein
MIKLTEQLGQTAYDFDPNATTATAIAWVDMKDYCSLLVAFVRTVGVSALTFLIQGSASSDGSSPVTVKTITLAAQPDAVGDVVFGEADVNDMLAAGTDLRYLSAVLTVATGTDEGVVVYTLGNSKHKEAGSTADTVA